MFHHLPYPFAQYPFICHKVFHLLTSRHHLFLTFFKPYILSFHLPLLLYSATPYSSPFTSISLFAPSLPYLIFSPPKFTSSTPLFPSPYTPSPLLSCQVGVARDPKLFNLADDDRLSDDLRSMLDQLEVSVSVLYKCLSVIFLLFCSYFIVMFVCMHVYTSMLYGKVLIFPRFYNLILSTLPFSFPSRCVKRLWLISLKRNGQPCPDSISLVNTSWPIFQPMIGNVSVPNLLCVKPHSILFITNYFLILLYYGIILYIKF